MKINNLTEFKDLGYSGIMTNILQRYQQPYISKAMDLSYLRGQVIALLKLRNDLQSTINKLEDQIKKHEKEKEKNK